MLASLLLSVLSISSAVQAAPRLGEGDWFQPRDSAFHELFKRAPPNPNDPNFANNYPAPGATPDTSNLPKAWTDKLASIQVPDIAPSNPNNGYPTYADGETPTDSKICSFTYQCTAPSDLVNPPDGVIAVSFDDGPTPESPTLYSFLAQNNIAAKVTHFMIGGNIVGAPTVMQDALNAGGHIAVHTWSHPYMTTLTNQQLLAEFGWTMQIIYDLSGGRVPGFWRPPYGDVDNRVRAIASGVFGLETVPWNQDSGDWAIGNNPQYTNDSVHAQMQQWLTGSKTPGLLILEHETNPNTVGNFEFAYPLIVSNNWKVENVAQAFGKPLYQNAQDSTGAVQNMTITGGAPNMNGTTSSSSSSASASSTSKSASSSTSSVPSSTSSVTPSGSQRVDAATTSGAATRGAKPAGMGEVRGIGAMAVVCVGTVMAMLL